MSEEKTNRWIRISKSLNAWLDETVKGQSVSDYVCSLIEEDKKKRDIELDEYEQGIKRRLLSSFSEGLPDALIHNRRLFLESKFRHEFLRAEDTLDIFAEEKPTDVDFDSFPRSIKEYLDTVRAFEPSELRAWGSLRLIMSDLEEARKKEASAYGGNPDEVIYRGITRAEIYRRFPDKSVKLSVMQVAGAFGLNYDMAYRHVVPWMAKEGWKL
jgi:hypothetical protein